MKHFVLIFDIPSDSLVAQDEYADSTDAHDAFSALERKHMGDTNKRVLMLSAESLETLKTTHSNFFSHDDWRSVAAGT